MMAESGWEMWVENDGTKRYTVTLTSRDAMLMDPVQLAMLEDAAKLIELVFDKDTPAALAELRADEQRRPRRLAEMSPDELRDVLTRMQGHDLG